MGQRSRGLSLRTKQLQSGLLFWMLTSACIKTCLFAGVHVSSYIVCIDGQSRISEFTEDDALKYAGVQDIAKDDDERSVFPDPIIIDDSDELLTYAVKDLQLKHELYNPIENGCEYTRCEFNSTVLVLAASFASVKLAREEHVQSSASKGPVDWMAHYQNYRICIAEGKKTTSVVVYIKILHNWRLPGIRSSSCTYA